MPQVVTHILIPIIVLSFFRDYYLKKGDKKKFPLHYVLIGGIAGIIPDLDFVAFWFLSFFGFGLEEVHRTITHTLYVPLLFFVFGLLFHKTKIHFCHIRKHELKLSIVLYLLAFGSLSHLLLDGIFSGYIAPFYPFSTQLIGLDIFGYLPVALQSLVSPCLDAGLLILWLIYLEMKHKISDFI